MSHVYLRHSTWVVVTAALCAGLGAFACNASDDDASSGGAHSGGVAGSGGLGGKGGSGQTGGASGHAGGTPAKGGNAGQGGSGNQGGSGGTGARDAVAGEGGSRLAEGGEAGASSGAGGEGGSGTPSCPTLSGSPVLHASETIAADARWTGWHRIEGELTLTAKLELAPCTVLAFGNGAALHVFSDGSLKAKGVAGQPVLFTSAKASPKPGDWAGIQVGVESRGDSLLEHAIIEYAGVGGVTGFALNANATAGLSHVLVRHNGDQGTAIYLAGRPSKFADVRTEDSPHGLTVRGNVVGSLGSFTSDGPPIQVEAEDVTTDGVWHDFGVPYVLSASFTARARLGFEPGVVVEMANQGAIHVQDTGILEAVGTEARPVRFTSSKASPAPGDWSSIIISAADDNASRLEHVIIEYGGYGNHSVDITPGAMVALSHVTITHNTDADCALAYILGSFVGPFDHVDLRGNAYPLCVPFSEVGNLGSLVADDGAVALVGAETSTMDATWKDLGLAYRILGNVTQQGDLALEEGVTVEVAHASTILVNGGGTLNVFGTEDAPVTFKSTLASPAPEEWAYVAISSDAGPLNSFAYTRIQEGGFNDGGALLVNMHAVPLDHVTFEDNGACDVKFANDGTVLADLSSPYVACP